jgi:hypothetical protein
VQSGAAPEEAGVELSFAHGQGKAGEQNRYFCYDHQGSYGDRLALYATMYAIVKIARLAQWHKKESA